MTISRTALANVQTLQGLLPFCAWCKSIRDDKGDWNRLESYVLEHSFAEFTHGICPICYNLHDPINTSASAQPT